MPITTYSIENSHVYEVTLNPKTTRKVEDAFVYHFEGKELFTTKHNLRFISVKRLTMLDVVGKFGANELLRIDLNPPY